MSKENLDAFFAEYYAISKPHPWDAREQCWENYTVTTEVAKHEYDVHISSIVTAKTARRTGAASRVLKQLTDLADKHGIELTLIAEPIGKDGPRKKTLHAWYEKHGFGRMGTSDHMVRSPKVAP